MKKIFPNFHSDVYNNLKSIYSCLALKKSILFYRESYLRYLYLFYIELLNFDVFFLNSNDAWKSYLSFSEKRINKIKLLKEKTKSPILFVTIHYGNWELIGLFLAKNFPNLATLYRPLDNYLLDNQIKLWRHSYIELISKFDFYPKSFLHMQRGGSLILLVDQYATKNGVKISFLGKNTYVSKGLYYLISRVNPLIVVCSIKRMSKDTSMHKISLQVVHEKLIEKNLNSEENLLQLLFSKFEKLIKKNPGQWNWLHRFWRSDTY